MSETSIAVQNERVLGVITAVIMAVILLLLSTLFGALPLTGIAFLVGAGYLWLRWALKARSDRIKYVAIALTVAAVVFLVGVDGAVTGNFIEGNGLIQKTGRLVVGNEGGTETSFGDLPLYQKTLLAVAGLFAVVVILEALRRLGAGLLVNTAYIMAGLTVAFALLTFIEGWIKKGTVHSMVPLTASEQNVCFDTRQTNLFQCQWNGKLPAVYQSIGTVPAGGHAVLLATGGGIIASADPEGKGSGIGIMPCIYSRRCRSVREEFKEYSYPYPNFYEVAAEHLIADLVDERGAPITEVVEISSREERYLRNNSDQPGFLRLRCNCPDELAGQRGLKASKVVTSIAIYSGGGYGAVPASSVVATRNDAASSPIMHQTNRDLARFVAREYGWEGAEWEAIETLWGKKESGWNHSAVNPKGVDSNKDGIIGQDEHACGIPQALPCSKMTGGRNVADVPPLEQMQWGLQYIRERYGAPSAALAYWRRQPAGKKGY